MERLCLKLLKSSTDRDLHAIPNRIININETREKHVNASKGKTNATILFLGGCDTGSWLLHGLFSSCGERKLLTSCGGFFLGWFLLLKTLGSRHASSIVAAPGLSSPLACGIFLFSSVQLSRVQPTLCDPVGCSMSGFPVHHKLIHVHWVSDAIHLILCHPLLPPSIFPSIRVFSN